jgi:flavin-dependent dehydrogenase
MIPRTAAIMGCGPGGSYLYALLKRKKPETRVAIFGISENNACGIRGCGWGLNYSLFCELCRDISLIPEKYVLHKCSHIIVDNIKVESDIAIVDKPTFVRDLLNGEQPFNPTLFVREHYDRIIDATGIARAFLSPCRDITVLQTIQYRTTIPSVRVPHAFLSEKSGYSWIFPLTKNEVHVGSGAIGSIQEAVREADALMRKFNAGPVICSCRSFLRHRGPIRPFTENIIWGLGESIGLVNPIAGAGIIAAMISANIMVKNWNDAQEYENEVWKRFSYMQGEFVKLTNKTLQLPVIMAEIGALRNTIRDVGVFPSLSTVRNYIKMKRT